MLFMAYVLPVCELVQGKPILQSTEFPSGPRSSKDSATGGLDFNASQSIHCIWTDNEFWKKKKLILQVKAQ